MPPSRTASAAEGAPTVGDPMLLLGGHLGEGAPLEAVGDEDGVVPEPGVTHRRPCDGARHLPGLPDVGAVRPGHHGHGAEFGMPPVGIVGSDPVQLGEQLGHVVGVGRMIAGEPGRVDPGCPPRASTSSPVSSDTAAIPVASTRPRALSLALSTRVSPVSSTSGTEDGRGSSTSPGTSDRMATISAALSGLALATTNLRSLVTGATGARRAFLSADRGAARSRARPG